jgi:sugar phosphate isomerase/epimerase
MKFGYSSYTFHQYMSDGRMSLLDVMDWIAASPDGEHMEIATVSLSKEISNDTSSLDTDQDMIDALNAKSRATGVTLSNLVIPANFATDSTEEYDRQLARCKSHLDLADKLGIRLFRHDVATWAYAQNDYLGFEAALPKIVEASKEIAQYAAKYGITTSIENHGKLVNASERVQRVIHLVDEVNFKTTLDIGNFLVVDEDPGVGTRANIGLASIVHLKDFYIRREAPSAGWLATPGGKYLKGSIVGHGDMDIRGILTTIKGSGYDGFISLEFEGMEDALLAASLGLANAKRILSEV